jgi:hypothetical protein
MSNEEDSEWDPEKHTSYGYRMVRMQSHCGAHYLKICRVIFKKDKPLYIEENENLYENFANTPNQLKDRHLAIIDILNSHANDAFDFPFIDEKTMKELSNEEWTQLNEQDKKVKETHRQNCLDKINSECCICMYLLELDLY